MSLVESVEAILDEALARVRSRGKPDSSEVTRDIINAVADRVERLARSKELGVARAGGVGYSAKWLRSQANPDSEDGK